MPPSFWEVEAGIDYPQLNTRKNPPEREIQAGFLFFVHFKKTNNSFGQFRKIFEKPQTLSSLNQIEK
jgi:hypothetical protein